MPENIINKYFAWKLKCLITSKDYSCRNFEAETGLNLTRITQANHDFTSKTLCKACKFFAIGPDEFYADFKQFITVNGYAGIQ